MSVAEDELKQMRKAQEELLSRDGRSLWKSVDELSLAKPVVDARRGQEFSILLKDQLFKDQVGRAPETTENLPPSTVSRREFFKYFTAAGALIGTTACTRRPKDYLVPYVNKPEGYIFGVPVWYASTTPDGVGVLVKTREGRPIKLEGNPDHPQSRGGMDAQSQAQLLNLFNPDRLRSVLQTKNGRSIDWAKLDEEILKSLSMARPGSVRVLVDDVPSPALDRALEQFRIKYNAKVVRYRQHPVEAMAKAHEVLGRRGIPFIRFDKADVVVSVDADFLGRWLRPTEFTKDFSSRRNIHQQGENQNQLFVFESQYSITGIAADYRFPIKPSAQLKILLALAGEISKSASFDGALSTLAQKQSLDSIAAETGVPASEIQRAASALVSARGKSVLVTSMSGPQALACQIVAANINDALGNYGPVLDWSRELRMGRERQEDFDLLVKEMSESSVDVLITQGVNPVYGRPQSGFAKAMSKVPFVASMNSELDETAKLATYALAESHFIEAWGDAEAVAGTYSIQQPVIEPLFESRSFLECLLKWNGDARDAREFIRASWRDQVFGAAKSAVGFDEFWDDQLRMGAIQAAGTNAGGKMSGGSSLVEAATSESSGQWELVAYESPTMGDGRHANNAWLQELPEPVSKVAWGNYASLSPAAAKKLNVNQHDEIEIQAGSESVKLSVFVQPGIREDVVVVPLGYGRTQAGTLGTGVGQSLYGFSAVKSEALVFSNVSVQVKKTGRRVELATTQQQFDLHGRDHDILQQTTVGKFMKDATAAKDPISEKAEKFSLYSQSEHPYPGHRWGMAIDLNKCTGCQACVVACYSENNIGIVGKDQVAMGRHLAWLRLDLYYKGDEKNPSATFEPMLCQHCERAPCETVCPVLATVHSSDGLNDMIYNRCVGTRYCANNCPYKVRRFNYFYYSKALAGRQDVTEESPLSLMLNPDVTVRSRGVMEKCTFCVQRIRKGVDEIKAQMGKDYRYRIPDGHVKTACEQSCPADAITFGDLNDPKSKVVGLSARAQSFKVLAVLNTNPSVSYLPRLRNREEEI